MEERWRIEDLIDLEYFLAEDDRPQARAQAAERDRAIFLDRIASLEAEARLPRPFLLLRWLAARREARIRENGDTPLPGVMFRSCYRLLAACCGGCGLLVGVNICALLLRYDGVQPVNVTLFLLVLVASQVLLLLVLLTVLPLVARRPGFLGGSPLLSLLGRLLAGGFTRLATRGRGALGAAGRDGLDAVIGLIHGRRLIYGNLMARPLFLLTQVFGIAFNLGILAFTLLRVISSDLAFGWQSTLRLGADAVHRLASALALPWSWLPGPILPSLEQVEGSRMVLKDGLYRLATTDLVAWWPFMLLAVLVYGLLPRLLLLALAWRGQRRLLRRIPFTHADCEALLRRMCAPRVDTRITKRPESSEKKPPQSEDKAPVRLVPPAMAAPPEPEPEPEPIDLHVEASPAEEPGPAIATEPWLALVAEEIFPDCDQEELARMAHDRLGIDLGQVLAVNIEERPDTRLSAAMTGHAGLFVLLEGWQPPIRETLLWLTELRRTLGHGPPLTLSLVGKPRGGRILTPLDPISRRVWQDRTAALGDPWLRLEVLTEE